MAKRGAFTKEELALTGRKERIFELIEVMPPTSQEAIDEALLVLQRRKDFWVTLDIPEQVSILEDTIKGVMDVADRWVALSLKAKRVIANTMAEAEEWVLLATIVRGLLVLRQSLIDIQKHGSPRITGHVTQRPDGQVVAQVFPRNWLEGILFGGVTGEVWMEPDISLEETTNSQARAYQDRQNSGKVALVLGAGNASALPIIDVLHKLFVEKQVVVLKLNPVNDYLGPLIEEGFRSLIGQGFLRLVYGGIEQGSYLSYHPAVEEIHMTGSDKTFEALTFGSGPEGEMHKAECRPLLNKRFTCELGNVSPVIIVPGPWDDSDIEKQAGNLATWLVVNAGFGCLTPRVIIQHASWAKRDSFVEAIGHVLAATPTRSAYYPGAKERHSAFIRAHPEALQFGEASGDQLPWTLIPRVNPAKLDDICFKREAFCSLFAETGLEASSVTEYIDHAVEFANDTLWGTLTATLIVHSASLADPIIAASVDRAIAKLRYGTVLVNLFAYYSAYFMVTPWGGFPGSNPRDIQSGVGKTYNMLMFDRPQKSVVRAPFKIPIDPLTVTSRCPHVFARKLAAFEASPGVSKIPGLLYSALRS
jgi:acyl-CoA reductase-like NAD-dependent aldehyde dehydrogenase